MIGGLCLFIIISGMGSNLEKIYIYPIFAISYIFIIYRITIGLYALKQWIFNIKSGKLLVRNSPLNIYGTIFKARVNYIKATNLLTFRTGRTFALCY